MHYLCYECFFLPGNAVDILRPLTRNLRRLRHIWVTPSDFELFELFFRKQGHLFLFRENSK